ncbi:immunity 22 family protein [Chryseobacterium sp. Mn2064]|uniref:immunity 22 family protein n=1 Tax=Chryseobacterium sp. Mn2064 TaxID=3395263 RepID=UPI003BBC319E
MEKNNKIHLWIGTTFKPEEEYQKYFELDYSTEGDFDNPKYKLCEFCKDIGKVWYDQDFIGIIPRFEEEVSLDEILEESSTDPEEWDSIKDFCHQNGIEKANAVFWYADGDLVVPKPYRTAYNGLQYIGMFEGD